MLIKQLIGKTITNIYEQLSREPGGLDKGECFIELDHTLIIDIPYSFETLNDKISIKELDKNAVSVFKDLDKLYPIYHVNKEGRRIKEIVDKYALKKPTLFQRLKRLITGQKSSHKTHPITEYIPSTVEYVENKFKHIKDRTIKDLITFQGDDDKYLLNWTMAI